MNFRVFSLLLIILFSFPIIYSQNYYADITIDVNSRGQVSIDGETNYPNFENVTLSDEFTSKDGKYWLLNITSTETFENFIFELNLPPGAQTTYIKTTPSFRILESSGSLILIGTGENKPFTLLVQYEINQSNELVDDELNVIWFLIVFSLTIIIGLIGVAWYLVKKEKRTRSVSGVKKNSSFDISILPQRQQDIIYILKKKGKLTQKELEKMMDIPKSSISRNVKTLEVKGLIRKEKVGQTNYLFLEE